MSRLLLTALVSALVAAAAIPATASAAEPRTCGVKRLFGKPLVLHVKGKPVSCARARRIARGKCTQSLRPRRWACFSFRTPGPLLVWFKERERFARRWSTWIEAHRYPCDEANVTAAGWARARASRHRIFPTRMQVYADDVIRCRLLTGKSYEDVTALLGKADDDLTYRGERQLAWEIGPERDSFFQLDSDFLSVVIGRGGVVTRVEQFQG